MTGPAGVGYAKPSGIADGGELNINGGNGFIAIQHQRQAFYNDFTFTQSTISPYNYVLVSQDDSPDRSR
eukprot:116122-Hanusia_phi.AAC.1